MKFHAHYRFLAVVLGLLAHCSKAENIAVTVENDANALVTSLLGPNSGLTIVSTSLTGHDGCAGIFSQASKAVPWFPDSGLVLSSGSPQSLDMNDKTDATLCAATPGDPDLDKITKPYPTHDACVLEIAFTADAMVESVEFNYIFGSDEYLEWSTSEFTDAFALFLNGNNLALITGTTTPVSINNINQHVNAEYFHDNELNQEGGPPYPKFEADGFTDVFRSIGSVQPGTNVLKLAIADTTDCYWDSWVLLEGGSLYGTSCPMAEPTTGGSCGFSDTCDYGHVTCCDGSSYSTIAYTCVGGTVVDQDLNPCDAITCPTDSPTKAPTNSPTKAPTKNPTNSPVTTGPPPGANGDPHFVTWNGTKYDFHGGCDLVLLAAPNFANGLGLTVHIRTKIESWWSFIESVAIQIGDHTFELRGGQADHHPYWVNGFSGDPDIANDTNLRAMEDSLSRVLPGFQIHYKKVSTKQHKFRMDLNLQGGAISFQTYKEFVAVNIKIGSATDNFFGSTGLLGSYPNGALVGRHGNVIQDTDLFGQEWQVRPDEPKLFQDNQGKVLSPSKCSMPAKEMMMLEKKRRLGESMLTTEAAEAVCVSAQDFDSCVHDVLATNDIEMAGAF